MAPNGTADQVSKQQFEIAIIGGGFAGLCFAIGLQRHKIPYQIYEAGSSFSEIGAGITFAPNGVHAMGKLHPAIEESFLKQSTSNGHGSSRDLMWDLRDGLSDETPLLFSMEGYAYRSIHRATFLSILTKLLLPETIHFNKRLENIQQSSEGVSFSFEDGTKASATVLIGCDGVRSSVRGSVIPENSLSMAQPQYSNAFSYRGLIPMEKVIAEFGKTLATTAQNYVGREAHVITYPVEGGKMLNIVGCKFDSQKEWPHERWQIAASRKAMEEDLACFGSTVRKLLSLIESHDRWAVFNLSTPLSPFHHGRVAIIGDAAHSSTPHMGAGASLAIEDAYVLSNLMNDIREVKEIEPAFRAFDAFRRPRTENVIITSLEMVRIYQQRAFNIEDIIPSEIHNRFKSIWDIDLEEHYLEIKEMFRSECR